SLGLAYRCAVLSRKLLQWQFVYELLLRSIVVQRNERVEGGTPSKGLAHPGSLGARSRHVRGVHLRDYQDVTHAALRRPHSVHPDYVISEARFDNGAQLPWRELEHPEVEYRHHYATAVPAQITALNRTSRVARVG